MTYCVGILVDDGVVLVSDSRTNAGIDRVSTFRKLFVFEKPGERVFAMVSAGSLSISQGVVSMLSDEIASGNRELDLNTADSTFNAANMVGQAIRIMHDRHAEHLQEQGIEFDVSFIFAGQVAGGRLRLFQIYAAGNFIEATAETPFFQIGETKYGKPILDRVITPELSLRDAAKCALISFDSTMRSNVSVGPPIDVVSLRRDALRIGFQRRLEEGDAYLDVVRNTWGRALQEAFENRIPDPDFDM